MQAIIWEVVELKFTIVALKYHALCKITNIIFGKIAKGLGRDLFVAGFGGKGQREGKN